MKRIAVLAALSLIPLVAAPALAGGSWLSPVQDELQPGDAATFVGYVGTGQLGWIEDGPFFAYLRAQPISTSELQTAGFPYIHEDDIPLGQLQIEDRGDLGYLSLRISITFQIPPDLAPGEYDLVYCNDPCTEGIGDLIGGIVLVGTESRSLGCREWAFDDPEIVNLSPDAEVCGPGGSGTAAEILARTVTQSPGGLIEDGSVPADVPPPTALDALRHEIREAARLTGAQNADLQARTDQLFDYQQSAVAQINQELLAVRVEDNEELSPAVLAAVVLGLTALAIVTVAAARKRETGSG